MDTIPTTGTGGSSGSTKANKAPDPPDQVLQALKDAVTKLADVAPATIAKAVDDFLDGQVGGPPKEADPNICVAPDASIAAYCAQRALDNDTATNNFNNAQESASAALRTARNAWSQAQSQYDFNIKSAQATMAGLVKAAKENYTEKTRNSDSRSGSLYLFYAMQGSIAAAVVAFEKSAATAASTLAAAGGSMLTAYANYVTAINAAESQRLAGAAAAEQAFWQKVELVRDAI